MKFIRLVVFSLCSFFVGGVVHAQNDNLGRVADFASELGYHLILTPEEASSGSFSCEEGSLPSAFDNSTPAGKTVCEGTINNPRVRVSVSWKSANYKKIDAARDIGNRILSVNGLRTGDLKGCAEEGPKKLGKIDVVVAQCDLVAGDGPTFRIAILFLNSKSFGLGTSRLITTMSVSGAWPSDQKSVRQDQESVRQELDWIIKHLTE